MRQKSVLFVDDDQLLLEGLNRALRNKPFYTVSVNSADEAMNYMSIQSFDAVVSDNWMKGMSGTEFLKWAAENCPGTARILLTGQPNLVGLDRTEAAFYCVIAKPVGGDELAETILKACEETEPILVNQDAPVGWRKVNSEDA